MTVRIKIYGHVQGVFFRQSAKAMADKLSIGGWIRNNPDGSVETLAVGSKEDLEKFIAWCKKGPSAAGVERVIVVPKDNGEQFSFFEILN